MKQLAHLLPSRQPVETCETTTKHQSWQYYIDEYIFTKKREALNKYEFTELLDMSKT
jgi:hypothetical protein